MHPQTGNPEHDPRSAADTAADRRRPGRPAAMSPDLVPILRGHYDPDLPPDPVLPAPGQIALHRDLILGTALASTLLLAGALLRFVP